MAIEPELMRSCILEAMRQMQRAQTWPQYELLKGAVAGVAQQRDLPVDVSSPFGGATQVGLRQEDLRCFREMIWSLVVEGLVTIGVNDANPQWPWLSLTEYGEKYAKEGQVTPYDPDGYLKSLTEVGVLDPMERRYIPQALAAFRKGLPDASAVMIGAASEHLLIRLGDEIEQKDASVATVMHAKLEGNVLPLLREVRLYFEARRTKLPRPLQEGLGTTFVGVADLIRVTRNDAGHPRLEPVSREQVFVNLQLFPRYRTWVLGAIYALPL